MIFFIISDAMHIKHNKIHLLKIRLISMLILIIESKTIQNNFLILKFILNMR